MHIKEHVHSPSVFFYSEGLSNRKHVTASGWKMDTFKGFLKRFKEEDVSIWSMQVSDFSLFCTSRYGCVKRKCWSHFTIDSYGGKGGSPSPCVFRNSEQKINVMTGNLGSKLNFFSITVCSWN